MSTVLEAPPEAKLAPSAPTVEPVVRFCDKPKPIVYVAASAYEWKAECGFVDSLLNAMANCHCSLIRDWGAGDAAIGRKRNYQSWRMLTQSKAEYLFFIDSDIIFQPWHLDRIVAHGLPICGGVYFKKRAILDPVIERKMGEEDPVTKLMKVGSCGTGFMCIRRDVLEKMIEKFPDIAYMGDPDPEKRWDFFPFGAVKNSYRSEDWYFCDRARECGFDVHVDCSVQLGHVGKMVFPMVSFMGDDDVIDLLWHKYDLPKDTITAFLSAAPNPLKPKTA